MNTKSKRAGTECVVVSCRIDIVVLYFAPTPVNFYFVDALFRFLPSCILDVLLNAGKRNEIMITCAEI